MTTQRTKDIRSFSFDAVAKLVPGLANQPPQVSVWTDGVTLDTEESVTERRSGFVPAYRLVVGVRYRVTVEPIL